MDDYADYIVFLNEIINEKTDNSYLNFFKTLHLAYFIVYFNEEKQIENIEFSPNIFNFFGVSPKNKNFMEIIELFEDLDTMDFMEKIYLTLESTSGVLDYVISSKVKNIGYIDLYLRGFCSRENAGYKMIFISVNYSDLNVLASKFFNTVSNYKELFTNNLDPIFIVDDPIIIAFNEAARLATAKYGIELKIGQSFIDLIDFDQKQQEIYKNIDKIQKYETEITLNNGVKLHIENSIVPLFIGDKHVKAFILKDLTATKRTIEELHESKKNAEELNYSLKKFLSVLSHDLRTSVIQVSSLSDIVIENFDDFSELEVKKYLRLLDQAGKNGLNLLDNMLEWAKLVRNNAEFQPQKFDLKLKIEEILDLLTTNFATKDINLIFRPVKCEILADKNMIGTALINLISNALKYTPKGGTIEIKLKKIEQEVEFSIKDTGIGISEIAMKNLFNLDKTYTTKGTENETGTGLGLILVQEIIKIHKGSIWAKSKVGEGATFFFRIPLKQ